MANELWENLYKEVLKNGGLPTKFGIYNNQHSLKSKSHTVLEKHLYLLDFAKEILIFKRKEFHAFTFLFC